MVNATSKIQELLQPYAKKLSDAGYVPLQPAIDWAQPLPMSAKDQESFGDAPVGIPEDWDYKTSEVGPDGRPLPFGAKGWTQQGEAYYGGNSSIGNWWNGIVARMSAPTKEGALKGAFDQGADYAKNFTDSLFSGKFGEAFANAIGAIQSVGDMFANLGEGQESSGVSSVLTGVGRGVNEVVSGALEAAQVPAMQIERLRGGLSGAGEAIGLGESITSKWIKDIPGDGWWESLLYSIDPIGIAWDLLRGTAGALAGKTEEFGAGYESGRILYSSIIDPLAKEEFERRYKSGENPYLLAQELQNPGAELAGQIIADPLNFIGLLTKPLKASKVEASVGKWVATIEDADVARDLSKFGDISDGAKVQAAASLTQSVSSWMKKVKGGIADAAQEVGFKSLTTESKRLTTANLTSSFMHGIATTLRKANPVSWTDDVIDAVRGYVLMANPDNLTDVAEGINVVTRLGLPTQVVFSPAGGQLGVVVRGLVSDASGKINATEFLSDLEKAKDVPTFLDKFDGKLKKSIDALYPTPVATTAKGKTIAGVEKVANSKIVKTTNNVFSTVFMGMSGGYWAKNVFVDSLTILIDEGLPAFLKRIKPSGGTEALEDLAKIFGDAPAAAKKGIGAASSAAGVTTEGGSIFKFALRGAQKSEAKSSAILFREGVVDTMNRGVKAMFANSAESLKKAGVDTEFLQRLFVSENYNEGAALRKYREALADGSFDLFKSRQWVSVDDEKTLRKFGRYDEYFKALDKAGDDKAAALAAHDEVFANADEFAAQAAKEPAPLSKSKTDLFGTEAQKGYLSGEWGHLRNNQRAANDIAEDAYNSVFEDYVELAKKANVDLDTIIQKRPEFASLGRHAQGTIEHPLDAFRNKWHTDWDGRVMEYEKMRDAKGTFDYVQSAIKMGIDPATAEKLGSKKNIIRYFWEQVYFPAASDHFAKGLDSYASLVTDFAGAVTKASKNVVKSEGTLAKAIDAYKQARQWNNALIVDGSGFLAGADRISEYRGVTGLGYMNGIWSITPEGIPTPQLLRTINKYLPEGAEKFENLADVPLDVAREALRVRAAEKGTEFVDIGIQAAKNLPPMQPIRTAPWGNTELVPSLARANAENMTGIKDTFDRLRRGIDENFGARRAVFSNAETEKALVEFEKTAKEAMTVARFKAERVGKAVRDFALHDYDIRKNYDLALGLVFPYQFWYSRTYTNWMQRLVTNPGTIAAYAKYKDALADIHAGLPDWWKYNVNSDELFGIFKDNPLFFNLEQTLNPLNGITGVDFNDSDKRVNWWTALLDDIGKFGPSIWSPIQFATAFALQQQGEEEAASKWGGRLLPYTQTVESARVLLGLDKNPIFDALTFDPSVSLFSNGIDPYTRRRVGRALAAMVNEGQISNEVAIDAAYTQKGEWWDTAYDRAIAERAPGQLASFFLGTGFKARSISDIQIDEFYSEQSRLWNMRPDLTPDEFSQKMDLLNQKYPFSDTLLLANKQDDKRDAALAYNVINRLPPGGGSIAEAAGIPQDLYSKFWDTKGDWEQWSETDKARFMAGIVDMSAILAAPDVATRQEWTLASTQYKQVTVSMKNLYGNDIEDKVDQYFSLKRESEELADGFLSSHPEVEQALDYRARTIASNPFLTAYYGGIERIVGYYKGVIYSEGEKRFGADILDVQTSYYDGVKLTAKELSRLRAYWDFKHKYERTELLPRVASLATRLPDTIPASTRGTAPQSAGQTGILQELEQAPPAIPVEVLEDALGRDAVNLIRDYVLYGEPLPTVVQRRIEQTAAQAGITESEILRLLEQSLLSRQ